MKSIEDLRAEVSEAIEQKKEKDHLAELARIEYEKSNEYRKACEEKAELMKIQLEEVCERIYQGLGAHVHKIINGAPSDRYLFGKYQVTSFDAYPAELFDIRRKFIELGYRCGDITLQPAKNFPPFTDAYNYFNIDCSPLFY